MAKKQDSILEQALLQAQALEEALKTNAKGILANTLKQELDSLVKESDEEASDDEEDVVDEQGLDLDTDDEEDVTAADDDNADVDIEDSDEDDMSDDEFSDEDDEDSEEDDFEIPTFGNDDDEDDVEDVDADVDMDDEDGDTIDMTSASDDEILKIFKKMGENDGVVVKQDSDDEVELTINDEDFLVKLNEDEEEVDEQEEVEEGEMEDGEVCEDEEILTDTDEPLYEIVFDDEDDFSDDVDMSTDDFGSDDFSDDDTFDFSDVDDTDDFSLEDSEFGDIDFSDNEDFEDDSDLEVDETEFMETARTQGNGNRPGSLVRKGARAAKNNPALNEGFRELKKENKLLKEKVEEYKKALGVFRDKLNEVAVFNANLAYATRLFTEHSTTKQEKMDILKRFDETSTLKESQTLYKSIKNELNSKATITENVANKIVKTPNSGSSSKEVLEESKAYTSPQFERIKDLFNKVK